MLYIWLSLLHAWQGKRLLCTYCSIFSQPFWPTSLCSSWGGVVGYITSHINITISIWIIQHQTTYTEYTTYFMMLFQLEIWGQWTNFILHEHVKLWADKTARDTQWYRFPELHPDNINQAHWYSPGKRKAHFMVHKYFPQSLSQMEIFHTKSAV